MIWHQIIHHNCPRGSGKAWLYDPEEAGVWYTCPPPSSILYVVYKNGQPQFRHPQYQ